MKRVLGSRLCSRPAPLQQRRNQLSQTCRRLAEHDEIDDAGKRLERSVELRDGTKLLNPLLMAMGHGANCKLRR